MPNWARQAAQLDRLWDVTRPAEPAPEVWDNLWSQVAHSLDSSTAQEVASPVTVGFSESFDRFFDALNCEVKSLRHSAASSFRFPILAIDQLDCVLRELPPSFWSPV